jgi:hypothetical protein
MILRELPATTKANSGQIVRISVIGIIVGRDSEACVKAKLKESKPMFLAGQRVEA